MDGERSRWQEQEGLLTTHCLSAQLPEVLCILLSQEESTSFHWLFPTQHHRTRGLSPCLSPSKTQRAQRTLRKSSCSLGTYSEHNTLCRTGTNSERGTCSPGAIILSDKRLLGWLPSTAAPGKALGISNQRLHCLQRKGQPSFASPTGPTRACRKGLRKRRIQGPMTLRGWKV